MTLAVVATLTVSACGIRSAQPPPPPTIERYTFPLSMPGNTLICAEALPVGYTPCMPLRRLRNLLRDTEAD